MNIKQQRVDIDTLYWLSEVMTNGDTMQLTKRQYGNVFELKSLLELDPRYRYILSESAITKIKKQ